VSSALLLLPDFLLIVLGAVLYRFAPFEKGLWAGLEQIVYFVLFPSLLFLSTATSDFHGPGIASVIMIGFGATLTGIVLGSLARIAKPNPLDFASGFQCAFRFNSYISLAAASRLGGAQGTALMAILLGLNVPLANVAAVYALARHGQTHFISAMVRNPLIIATLAGLLCNALGVTLPDTLSATLSRLGAASIALGLMTVGAGLRLSASRASPALQGWFLGVKLLVLPALALFAAMQLGLPPLQRVIVVTFAAMPSASSAYILAARMGGNGPLVAYLVSIGTLISAVTLPLWLTLAR
jgi:hypothetical protein